MQRLVPGQAVRVLATEKGEMMRDMGLAVLISVVILCLTGPILYDMYRTQECRKRMSAAGYSAADIVTICRGATK